MRASRPSATLLRRGACRPASVRRCVVVRAQAVAEKDVVKIGINGEADANELTRGWRCVCRLLIACRRMQ